MARAYRLVDGDSDAEETFVAHTANAAEEMFWFLYPDRRGNREAANVFWSRDIGAQPRQLSHGHFFKGFADGVYDKLSGYPCDG